MIGWSIRSQLRSRQRKAIQAACVDMWEPFRLSIEHWAPQCLIVYDKFHIMQLANAAINEVRKAEFFRQGPQKRGLIKGKKWLLLSRWKNLTPVHRGDLNRLFQMNRRVFKAYLLKECLERLWKGARKMGSEGRCDRASHIHCGLVRPRRLTSNPIPHSHSARRTLNPIFTMKPLYAFSGSAAIMGPVN
jgi:transposase